MPSTRMRTASVWPTTPSPTAFVRSRRPLTSSPRRRRPRRWSTFPIRRHRRRLSLLVKVPLGHQPRPTDGAAGSSAWLTRRTAAVSATTRRPHSNEGQHPGGVVEGARICGRHVAAGGSGSRLPRFGIRRGFGVCVSRADTIFDNRVNTQPDPRRWR